MNLDRRPRKVEKLAAGCKVLDFVTHRSDPMILLASKQNKLESHYIKNGRRGDKNKLLPVKSLNCDWKPSFFSFSGNHNIVYACEQNLLINNKAEIKHKDTISHLLVDDCQIAITTAKDKISVCSTQKGQLLTQLHSYKKDISAIFWHNSLVIAGQLKGGINVWDLNKQKVVHRHSINAQKIDQIDSYVDYIHTNVYYSLAIASKRLAFHDLRCYKPLKIINNLNSGVKQIRHNSSGKIFLMNQNNIEIIDLYQNIEVVAEFRSIDRQKLGECAANQPRTMFPDRNLNDLLIEGKFVVAGCSNGSIQIYNSDTLELQNAFSLCQTSEISKLRKVNNSIIALNAREVLHMIEYG